MASSSAPDDHGKHERATTQRRRRTVGLAVLLALVQIIGTAVFGRGQPTDLDLVGYALLAVSGLALATRRYSTALVVAATATVTYDVLDYPQGPTFLALIIAAFMAVRAGHRRMVAAVVSVSYAAWILLTHATRGDALTLAAWVVGIGLVSEIALVAAKFAGQMMREEQRIKDERQRRQASEERLRIATELHDVLGHHLSLINVRAGVGRHLMDRQPDQARAALDTIKEASAEALREVQSVLNALYPTGEAAPRAPAPGLERLDELTVDAGLPVHTAITGERRALPAEIDRAAYRIVQEALTNVRRHADPAATATIKIDYQPDELVVQVENDGGAGGHPAVPATEGNGISGMRERASSLGGSLTAEPRSAGGWRVRAVLPLPAEDSAAQESATNETPVKESAARESAAEKSDSAS